MNEDTAYQMLFPETGKRPEGAADYSPGTNELVTLRQENQLLRESLARAENTLGMAHEGFKGAVAAEKRLRADLDWFIRKAESQWEQIKELETANLRLTRELQSRPPCYLRKYPDTVERLMVKYGLTENDLVPWADPTGTWGVKGEVAALVLEMVGLHVKLAGVEGERDGLEDQLIHEKKRDANAEVVRLKTLERLEQIKDEQEAEITRLKRGDFTPEEFQNLCHHRDEKEGCTLKDFSQGCLDYQRKLFGRTL